MYYGMVVSIKLALNLVIVPIYSEGPKRIFYTHIKVGFCKDVYHFVFNKMAPYYSPTICRDKSY